MELDLTPHFAPLSRPFMLQAASLQVNLKRTPSVQELLQDFHDQWAEFISRFSTVKDRVYKEMTPAVDQQTVSSDWFIDKLAEFSPKQHKLSHETLSRWREQGLLTYQSHNRPDYDSVAALFTLRMLTDGKKIKGWTPSSIEKYEPQWWCWRQDTPTSPVLPCPVPLPEAIPPHALLWTTWQGAAWKPDWLPVGNLGAARWAGIHRERNTILWGIPLSMLSEWDPEIAPFGFKVIDDAVPLATHTLATLALLRLVTPRLQEANVPPLVQ